MNENLSKRKRLRRCCIIGCTNVNKNEEVPYYHFPTHLIPWKKWRRQQWIDAVIKYNKQADWEPNKNTVICGSHFAGGKKSEHPQHPAFNPTIFPGQSSKNIERQVARFERRMKREQVKPSPPIQQQIKRRKSKETDDSKEMLVKPATITKEPVTTCTAINKTIKTRNPQTAFIKTGDMQFHDKEQRYRNFQAQTNMPNIHTNLPEYIMCNLIVQGNLNSAETQINLKSLNPTVKGSKEILTSSSFFKAPWLKPVEFNGISSINYDNDLGEICGVNFTIFNQILKTLPVMDQLTISNANRLLIFLMKLKQGLSTSVLSILFHLSPLTIDRIINETLEHLKDSLKSHIYWPKDRETMTNVLSNPFKIEYPNFRAIIDCLKIHIEVPTHLQARKEFYSQYQSILSFKIFFAFAPNGFIMYRSKCYCSKKCDALLADDSEFLEQISDNDVIFVIKQFPNLKSAVEYKKAVFVTPPFKNNCKEKYGIHAQILNSINQIKLFKILSSMPADLVSKVDDVVQVCCALNNLRLPLKKS